MNYEIECGDEYEIMHSKEPFADQVRSEELQSGLETMVEEQPKKKMGKLETFVKSYVFGLTAFTDLVGSFMHEDADPSKGDFKPVVVSDIGFKYAGEIKQENGDDYGFAIGMGAGMASAIATMVVTGGASVVATGLADTTYGIYRYARKAWNEMKHKKYAQIA